MMASLLGCTILGQHSAAAAKPAKMPSFVLTEDDPCLDDLSGARAECGTALLQSSNSRRHANLAPESETSHKQDSGKLPDPSRKIPTRYAAVTDLSLRSPNKAVSLLEQIRQRIAQAKVGKQTTHDVGRLAGSFVKLIEAETMPKIHAGFREHQALLQASANAFDRCDADLQGRVETGHQLKSVFIRSSRLHEECHSSELELGRKLQICKQQRTLLQESMQDQAEQSDACHEVRKHLEAKTTECKSLERSKRTANCARASQVSGICDMYDICRASMALAYGSTKEAAAAWESYHKTELLAASAIRCFAESNADTSLELATLQLKFEDCEQKAANASFSRFDYQDLPIRMECIELGASDDAPCAEEISAAKTSLAAADDAQRSNWRKLPQSEAVTGLSLMQQELESVSMSLPKQVYRWHNAFFGPWATPISLTVVVLTMLMLIVRCSIYLDHKRAKRSEHLAVDAWCIKSQGSTNSKTSTLELSASSKLLCHELVVPARSKCAVMLPRLGMGHGASSVQVTDKLGQPLFRASLAASAEHCASGEASEKLTLTLQDGTVLMTCLLIPPKGRSEGHCDFLQRDGKLFASMTWDSGKVTWLSRLFKRSQPEEGAFIVKDDATPFLRVLPTMSTVGHGPVRISDALRRSVAQAEYKKSGTSGHCQETIHIEVSSESTVDLGFMTAAVVAVDRLSFVNRGLQG